MKISKPSLIALLLLAGLSAMFWFKNDDSTLKPILSDFSVQDTASVTQVIMKDKSANEVTLTRLENGEWQVNHKHKARQDGINNLLETLKRVTVKYPVNHAAQENIFRSMSSNSTMVSIFQDGGSEPSKVYYVGNATQNHDGTHMLMKGSQNPFVTHMEGFYGYLTTRYFIGENDWRDREIFGHGVNDIKELSITRPNLSEDDFKIINKGDYNFDLLDAQNKSHAYDSTKLLIYLEQYQKIHFESYENLQDSAFIKGIIRQTPEEVYTMVDSQGDTVTVKTFLKPAGEQKMSDLEGNETDFDLDRMYAFVNNKDFVVIQYYVFGKLDQNLDFFFP